MRSIIGSSIFFALLISSCFALVQQCDTAAGMTVVDGACVPGKVLVKRDGQVEVGSGVSEKRAFIGSLAEAR